jgi:hypothetical protein
VPSLRELSSGDETMISNKNVGTPKILKLAQYISLASVLILTIIHYSLGDVFETVKTFILAFFVLIPDLRRRIRKEISYRELRNSIILMLIILWQFLLVDICLTLENLYGRDFGTYYLAAIAPIGALILFALFSGEWREIIYPTARFLKFFILLCKEWVFRKRIN